MGRSSYQYGQATCNLFLPLSSLFSTLFQSPKFISLSMGEPTTIFLSGLNFLLSNSHLLSQEVYQGVSQNKNRRKSRDSYRDHLFELQIQTRKLRLKGFRWLPETRELISLPILCQLQDTKPQRHNFPIKLPVPDCGPILRCNQLCFKHFGETSWSSPPSSMRCLWNEIVMCDLLDICLMLVLDCGCCLQLPQKV